MCAHIIAPMSLITGVSKHLTHEDHSYCSSGSLTYSQPRSKQGHTTLSTIGANDLVAPLEENPNPNPPDTVAGYSAQLLTEDGTVLGTGTTISGDRLHGKPVPPGHVRVIIEQIFPNIQPLVPTVFDDDFLCKGSITAWPTRRMKKV